MMQKLQRFGAAMFTPVLLFSFAGIMTAICILMTNQQIFGGLAEPTTTWYAVWSTLQSGAFTVFNIIPLLFVVGLPIGLAKKSGGRAAMESVVIYASWNYMINSMLTFWGPSFGVKNFVKTEIVANSTNNGLTNIIGIKTLDTSIVGALIVAGITVWLHNKYFDKKLPDWLGTFQGSAYIVILGYIVMIPLALLTCMIWPKIQLGIGALQGFMKTSGVIGVWVYCFLERVLIPTGLHHFIYIPFMYGPAAVAGGLQPWWFSHLSSFASSTRPLKELAPQMGFAMYGNEKVFGILGICLAFYATARTENKKSTAALLIPAGLTALLAGITEPVEFTFLFAAPVLWGIHAVLAATMDALMFALGVVGEFSLGLIGFASENWIPLWQNHWTTYIIQIIVGLVFVAIYYFVFKFMIEKFNYATPGREVGTAGAELITKAEYRERKRQDTKNTDPYVERATAYLTALGGAGNVAEITSCATRLRVTVKDENRVAADDVFKANKAVGVVHHGKALQVIVGLDVPQVLESIVELMSKSGIDVKSDTQNMTLEEQNATLLSDSLGMKSNIKQTSFDDDKIIITIKDISKVDDIATLKSLGIGISDVMITDNKVTVVLPDAAAIASYL